MDTFVVTVVGDDRPGLVDALAGVVDDHGGNWEQGQMARLGGKFAGIVHVTVPAARAGELRAALEGLAGHGFNHVLVDTAGAAPATAGARFVLELVGTDRPGLVHSVAAALAAIGASIEELSTATTSAPMMGGPLFEARAAVVLPAGLAIDAVRTQLEELADRLMVDIELAE